MRHYSRARLSVGNDQGRAGFTRLYAILAFINVTVWVWAAIALRHSAAMFGTAFLAYSFGLRHAVDADHIAAIDNVTRKLMNDGRRPVGIGFFFALGHSAVVILGSIGVALAARAVNHHFDALRATGAVVGTLVSASFLLLIGVVNIFVLLDLYRSFKTVCDNEKGIRWKQGQCAVRHAHPQGGLLARLFRPVFGMVSSSWLMFPLGFLFGLGFETATEIALLGTAATQASAGLPIGAILLFPCLFAAGMLTVDSADGVLMLSAYDWALVDPSRKLYYNLTITLISTLIALLIGGVEALGMMSDAMQLSGPFWHLIEDINAAFGTLGYIIIGIFVVGWLTFVFLYRQRGNERGTIWK